MPTEVPYMLKRANVPGELCPWREDMDGEGPICYLGGQEDEGAADMPVCPFSGAQVLDCHWRRMGVLAEDIFDKSRLPKWLTPAIGFALVGTIGIFYPHVLGNGYETVNLALHEQLPLLLLLVLPLAMWRFGNFAEVAAQASKGESDDGDEAEGGLLLGSGA